MPTSHPWNTFRDQIARHGYGAENPCTSLLSDCDFVPPPTVEQQRYRASIDIAQIFMTLRPGETMEVVAHEIGDGPMWTVTTRRPVDE